ncbi:NAD(P)/FAD-dependent oxidoreductase [Manganibacter manganicus]|uniref:D-amino-acid oxidase n=1 Tax=Manganibacter manganicus TaxID=1873176 RepID=A0A1V8RTN7_9HYPH|nr:FAD-binding oxidoreductase [Pseudaminobacter manganicus]OQM76503.1 D-amino-acid oxidase [Pseudaminobacter manganicus]
MGVAKKIVVVGSGIIGASIAWHLAKAGAAVTVISESAVGGTATPCSFAWINASWGNPEAYVQLRMRSMTEWSRLATEVPGLPLAWCGGLCFDMPQAELETYAAQHNSWGYGIREVNAAEAARIEPNLTEPPAFALHVATEGAAEPVALAKALLADAARHGAKIIAGNVEALKLANDKIVGVETAAGPLLADEVVIAAGAGAPALLATAGVELPLETPPGLVVHSRPHAPLLNGIVLSEPLHMRQTAAGRVIAGTDFGGTDPGFEPEETARRVFSQLKALLRNADQLELDFFTVGYRPTPIDGFPAIGRAVGLDGLYVAVMHSGVTLAPAIGLFAAREILEGERDALLTPYGLDRF